MNLLQQFVDFLTGQKNKPSFLTVKNYKADIGQFINWFEKEFKSSFNPLEATLQILEQYKKSRNLSPASIQRHISSLRKFFIFLQTKGIISQNPLEKRTVSAGALTQADPWRLRNFKSYLYEYKKSNLTIKNYINDIKSFFAWLTQVSLTKYAWDVKEKNLLDKINLYLVGQYKQRLITAKFSPRTINRKLSSLRNYIAWAKSQGLIPENSEYSGVQSVRKSESQIIRPDEMPRAPSVPNYSSFPPIRLMQKSLKGIDLLFDNFLILPLVQTLNNTQYLFWKVSGKKVFKKNVILNEMKDPMGFFANAQNDKVLNIKKVFYAPLNVSLHYLPKHKRIWHHIRHVRPKWYKTYHSYSITHYFHFTILVILAAAVGFGMYDKFFANTQQENAILGAVSSASPRILSFQGKITDSSGNPIVRDTNILFSIYNDENASGEDFLWQETNSVKPDLDGVFSALLGSKTSLPATLFSDNPKLFLGIKVGNGPELSPRQQLATIPLASNSETLQGLEPITKTAKVSNVVLALDSSGNLSIAGSKAHTFQTIGGQFVLSGKILSLTTIPGSNSNIEIAPDGLGQIDLSKPIQNSSNNNNLSSAIGAVEFNDMVAILATTSAQAALYVNQNSTGALISASTSGTAKFVVENDGTGTFEGSLGVNGSSLTSTATTFNLLNANATTLNFAGAATNLVIGATTGTITIKNANASIQGNITLGDAATDTITFTGRVAKDSDLIPIGTEGTNDLGFSSLPWDNAYIDNIYAASSGISGYWQRASGALAQTNISDDILIGAIATSSALIKFSGTSGNNSWINTGNVGIGTTAPSAKFEVLGGQTKIEVSTQYSQRLCHNGSDGSSTQSVLLGDCSTGGADIAEYYGSKDLTIEAGDVVVAAPGAVDVGTNSKAYVNKSDSTYQGSAIGVVSTNPYDSFGKNFEANEHSFPVALVGRIPVKISLENGSIKAGDLLTSSSIPGVAMKATKRGLVIGKALEDINSIDESKVIGFYDPDNKEYRSKTNFPDIPTKSNIIKIVKIYAFANISWYDPGAYLAATGDLIIHSTGSNGYSISTSQNQILTDIAGFFEVVAANIKAGLINTSDLITNSLVVTTDSIIVNGQNLKDYIVNVVDELGIKNQESGIISPVLRTNQLSANIISPLAEDSSISISLHDSQFIIHDSNNASGSAVATIDNQGNASFSGQLSSDTIITNNVYTDGLEAGSASISGILRARSIIAESIDLPAEAMLAALQAGGFIDIASFSAQLAYVPNLQAEQGLFNQGLMVFGSTSLSDLSVVGQLSIGGTMFVTENSIETLGTDLSLQSLRQGGLSIMGGLVYIDTEGNIKVQGNLSVTGKLAVNIISPLPTSDLVINNASGSSILSVNQTGDIVASGSGTFSKLNFSFVQPALAISVTELLASSSAGVANINSYQSEITIRNALVTAKSLIYITPVGTPSAQSPFLMRQVPDGTWLRQQSSGPVSHQIGSFTVGVQSPNKNPIPFNWLIVN